MTEPDFNAGVEFPDHEGKIFLMRLKYGEIWLWYKAQNGEWTPSRKAEPDDIERWLELAKRLTGAVQ